MSAWLSPPVHLHSSREFECEDFSDEDCRYYRHRWHFWYARNKINQSNLGRTDQAEVGTKLTMCMDYQPLRSSCLLLAFSSSVILFRRRKPVVPLNGFRRGEERSRHFDTYHTAAFMCEHFNGTQPPLDSCYWRLLPSLTSSVS